LTVFARFSKTLRHKSPPNSPRHSCEACGNRRSDSVSSPERVRSSVILVLSAVTQPHLHTIRPSEVRRVVENWLSSPYKTRMASFSLNCSLRNGRSWIVSIGRVLLIIDFIRYDLFLLSGPVMGKSTQVFPWSYMAYVRNRPLSILTDDRWSLSGVRWFDWSCWG
jgi:hypothetical protein